MDLVYSTVWETTKKANSRDVCGKVTAGWSNRNLIAFTTGYKKTRNPDDKSNKQYLSNAIHILDPDSPWDIFSFESQHQELINQVLWHSSGSRLLTIDLAGQCHVWTMKDYLINDWQCETVADIGEGERLVSVSWIDNGVKVLYSPTDDQHSSMNKKSFEEQFKSTCNKPPCTEFGGKAQDGWVSITESGLVCVTTTKPEIKTTRQSLCSARHHIAVADLAYTNQGKVIVAANDGQKSTSVQFYRVQIKSVPKSTCQIETFSLPCLFPHSRSELQKVTEYTVCDIQFVSKNSGEIVLVCTTGPFGTYIKRWDMRKEKVEKFQKGIFRTHSGVQPAILRWSCCASHLDGVQMVSLALPRLPSAVVETSQTLTFPAMAMAVSYQDGRTELVNSHSLLVMNNQSKSTQPMEPVSKKARTSQTPSTGPHSLGIMSALQFSPSCCCLLGVMPSGDISLYKLHHSTDGMAVNRMKRSLVDLFEYCLVTGWEWWDVLLASHIGTPADTAESVLKLLLDEFSQQQQVMQPYSNQQHMLIPKMMSLKASLYRCMKDGSGQAMDCHASQFLYAVAMLFRSLPSCSYSSVEQLTKACTLGRTSEMEIDKFVMSINIKEYAVESATLTAVHPLIQWITDLAMFMVAAFTTRHTKDSVPGVSLGRNPEVLGILKEMLVLIRLWGQSMPSIVPSITPSADKKDSLALLFKIITKMWIYCKQPSEGQEFEDRLAAEASPLLPNQLFIVNMKAPNLNRGVTGKPVSGPVKPAVYQFTNPPTGASVCHSYHPYASAVLPVAPESPYYIDVIRRVFIDAGPDVKLRQCTRCCCVSQLGGPLSQNVILQTWEQRWLKSCYCGGSWKKYNTQQT